MELFQFLEQNQYILLILGIWELVWKGFALWKSARAGEKVWFIAIIALNTVGILPIVYLILKKSKSQ